MLITPVNKLYYVIYYVIYVYVKYVCYNYLDSVELYIRVF